MKQALNALFAKIGVRLVRMGVWMKRPLVRVLGLITVPFKIIFGIALVPAVPVVRVYGAGRRAARRLSDSSKNRLMAFATHRYVIHVIVAGIVFSIVFLNMQTTQVRAETFGEGSQMYRLVAGERRPIIEEYAITPEQLETSLATGALDGTALSAFNRGIDSPLAVGGNADSVAMGTLSSGTGSQTSDSTAPRTRVETYVVETGDVFGTIAEKFGISVETILWANNLTLRSTIQPGDELTILPVTGVTHTVKSGDSLSRIASTYGVTQEEILAANGTDAEDLQIGGTLMIPDGTPPTTVASAPTTSTSTSTTVTTRPTTTTPSTSSQLPATSATPAAGGMIWPTDLYVITQYYGWGHTGIDIDCLFTNNNYAAADGTVSYSGWRNGYGYTVEINHGGGLTTRYAHHASLAVTTGQQVSQGQALGVCGTTGRSTGTHLHFEVMINGAFQNPLSYIR